MVILARGLGLLHLITNLLHFYDAAGNNLVLVVGADDRENEWIGEGRLGQLKIACCPTLMLSTHSVGGALCDQQVSTCTGIEGYQHGESYSAHAVGFGILVTNAQGYADLRIRERIYAEGGILSVTSRILVVDLLSSTLIARPCSTSY